MKRLATLMIVLAPFVGSAQDAPVIDMEGLKQRMHATDSGIHIINFWATWCGPCVKELPYFEAVNAKGNPDVKVTLVSLDLDLNPDPEKVYRFIRQRKIKSEVVLLNEADPNSWIGEVHPEWSGALPATLILNHRTGERTFIGRALREGELETFLMQ